MKALVELPSGKAYEESRITQIEDEIIKTISKHDLLVCDAKALLESTQQRIDETVKLQVSS